MSSRPTSKREVESSQRSHSSRQSYSKLVDSEKLIDGGNKRKTVVWTDIEATVPMQTKKKGFGRQKSTGRKPVLKGVSGAAYPGEILAIMGGSGAGKTTLLNILTLLSTKGVQYTGTVAVNGEQVDCETMRRMSAYIRQDDLFCGTLTVREQLIFSAALRMDRSVSSAEREEKVDQVIRQMNLNDCQNTLIGIPLRSKGISIGEKKRLAFACEVLTDPSILFCDEPTSGLDSFMAQQVVVALKELAKMGKTIITVIHQPSSEVFAMFDKVKFMAMGKAVYYGPVKKVTDFFNSIGIAELHVPESYNPADHVIAQLSIEPETREKDEERVELVIKKFEESEIGQRLYKNTHGEMSGSYKQKNNDDLLNMTKYASPWLKQVSVLFKRSFLTTLRDPLLLKVKIIQVFLTAIVISAVNWRTPIKGPTVQNIEGILYNTMRDMNFLFLFPSINVLTSELPIFFREHKSRIYTVGAYYWAKSLAELPQYTLFPIIYSTIVYWSCGLYLGFFQFVKFTIICVFQCWVAISVAFTGACLFGDEGTTVTFVPMLAMPMLVFGGFYVNQQSIPVYFKPFAYLSWFRYGFEAVSINQWTKESNIEGCSPLENGTFIGERSDFCPADNGFALLRKRGFSDESNWFWFDMAVLLAFFFAYRFIGHWSLIWRSRITN